MRPERLTGRLTIAQPLAHRVVEPGRSASSPESIHIVIPLELHSGEVPALRFGLQLAAEKHARVTVLHVLPLHDEPNPMHWLDAIERLHDAWSDPAERLPEASISAGLAKARAFLDREIPASLLCRVDVRVECQAGDFAREVARYAEDVSANLVLLSGGMFWGRLHILPGRIRSVLKLTRRRVAVVCAPLFGGGMSCRPEGSR